MKTAKITAGLAVCVALLASVGVGSASAAFGFSKYVNTFQDPNAAPGVQLLQAGSHADVVTELELNKAPKVGQFVLPEGQIRDVEVKLPAGFTGNPQATPTCTMQDLILGEGFCNPAAQVGVLRYASFTSGFEFYPVYNMKAADSQTATFATVVLGFVTKIVISVRTDGDYGLTAKLTNINQGLDLARTQLTFWGVPAASIHDPERFEGCRFLPFCGNHPAGIPPKPFLSLPGRCEPVVTELAADSWQNPGEFVSISAESPPLTGCEGLDFPATLKARPTTNAADSPSGLDLDLNIPQNADDPEGISPAHLRKAEVDFPEGLVVNPAGANGLVACTPQQIGYQGLTNERQILRYALPRANSYTVSFGGGTTAPLSATGSKAELTAALEALPGLAGNIVVSGGPGSWSVTFVGALAGTDVPALSAVSTDNATRIVEVTGEAGGFNLLSGADSTAATFKASYGPGTEQINSVHGLNRFLTNQELLEGPGIQPETTFVVQGAAFILLDKPATESQSDAPLKTQLRPGISAVELEIAFGGMPSLGEHNVIVVGTGGSGSTHSYELIFGGDLAGTEPPLTATSSLTGPGAGVVVKAPPPANRPVLVSTLDKGGVHSFDKAPEACPDASRIGSVEVVTPAFPDPLKGGVFTMKPFDNPFNSLLGVYIVAEGHGIVSKLPAQVKADPQTGRLVNVLEESPQQQLEDVRLKLDGGAAAVLRTPATCGRYTTTSTLTPWSAPETPPVVWKDEYGIEKGANGGRCGAPANSPSLEAGSIAPIAGAYSPFTVNLRREDGTQEFGSVTLNPPPGLVAKLKGTAICSDGVLAAASGKSGAQEKASPSCPAASEVGSVYAAAGAGPAPYNAPGKAYLAGPYKGAPLSLAIVTPAVAGPFDLGTIVVRAAVYIDPKTAQVTVKSDPVPRILEGIPLDVRSVSVRLDKPEFSLNPTSCDPTAVTGSLLSTAGNTAALNNRFQLAECDRLKFKPSLKLSLKGGTKRGEYPALKAVLQPRSGDANIASIQVALPHSEFLAQNHIRTVCTRVQFAADACPKGSIYGTVTVQTPILDYPLTGPVYLRSSDNPLPDLVPDLKGPAFQPIRFESAGKTDSIHGGIRNTFSFVPDVPFTKLTLQLQGGKKGLLVNSRNICNSTNRADADYTAHNGLGYAIEPVLKAKCKKANKSKPRKGKRGGKH
jgi:hypothetical protein